MMRILSNAPDPRFGGPLKRSLSVARRLRPLGIETVFLVPFGDDRFADRAREDGFECVRLDQPRIRSPEQVRANLRFLTGFGDCVRRTEAVVADRDIDVVHANGPLNYPVALAAAQSDTALVWHFNDTLTPTPLRQISATLARRWADSAVVAADAVREYFFDDSTETTTLYAPVDLDKFDRNRYDTDTLSAEFDIPAEKPIVGTVGNINPAKGHEHLIESLAALDRDAHLVIVGRELDSQRRYAEYLRQRIRDLGIESRVTFTGWRDDVPALLASFDLFVLASVTEACPMVVLEAMAMECPVVATNVGGVREQIPSSDHGWVVPAENPDALADAITDALAAADERRERAERARDRVESVFSLSACAEAHAQLYRSLAGLQSS